MRSKNTRGVFDQLYQSRPDLTLAASIAEALWPDFVEVDGFVFLAENYDPDYYRDALQKYAPEDIEATINTTYIDSWFSFGDTEENWEKLEEVGRLLEILWPLKAKQLFPAKDFVARFEYYSEDGDPGIVITQRRFARHLGSEPKAEPNTSIVTH